MIPVATQSFDLRSRIECNPESIRFLSSAYMLSASLFACIEIDIFTVLDDENGLTREALAHECGFDVRQLQKLVSFCMSLGLISDEKGLLRISSSAQQMLSTKSPTNICGAARHHQKHALPLFASLADSLRDKKPIYDRLTIWKKPLKNRDFYQALCDVSDDLAICLCGLNIFSRGAGSLIAQHIGDKFSSPRILDMGGGGGQVAVEIASALPGSRITLIDLPNVVEYATQHIVQCSVDGSVTCIQGDIFDYAHHDGTLFDVVVLSSVLGDWSTEKHSQILATAYRNLRPEGFLMVSETLLDEDQGGPILPTLMSLYAQVINEGGKNFTENELSARLERSGFVTANVILNKFRDGRDLIVAKKARSS